MDNRDEFMLYDEEGQNNNYTLDVLLPYRVYELQSSDEGVDNPIKFLEGAFLNKKNAEDFVLIKNEVEPEKSFLLENVWEVKGIDPSQFDPYEEDEEEE